MSDSYVRYMDKTREYYLGEGYRNPYRWAHFDTIPFTPLTKPLSECCVALVSTADIAVRSDSGELGHYDKATFVGQPYSLPSDLPPERLYSRNEHFDHYETNLDDVNSYYPVTHLREFVAQGRIGSLAPRFHGVYTSYSHRRTLETDAPEVLRRLREDRVDAVLLTPI